MSKGKSKIGNRLRELREDKNLGIKSAAPKADVTYSYLSKVENGHKQPTKELVEKLAKLYGTDIDELLALLGQLPDDLVKIISTNGKEVFDLIREKYAQKNKEVSGE